MDVFGFIIVALGTMWLLSKVAEGKRRMDSPDYWYKKQWEQEVREGKTTFDYSDWRFYRNMAQEDIDWFEECKKRNNLD